MTLTASELVITQLADEVAELLERARLVEIYREGMKAAIGQLADLTRLPTFTAAVRCRPRRPVPFLPTASGPSCRTWAARMR
jgi:hypothetical protein